MQGGLTSSVTHRVACVGLSTLAEHERVFFVQHSAAAISEPGQTYDSLAMGSP
jgi:hypothetical protein